MRRPSATPHGAMPSAMSMSMSMSKATASGGLSRASSAKAKFGEVVLTDILLSEQRIRRNNQHISQLDKECYYLQLIHRGNVNVVQRGETHRSNAGARRDFLARPSSMNCNASARSGRSISKFRATSSPSASRASRSRWPLSINSHAGTRAHRHRVLRIAGDRGREARRTARGPQLGSQLMDMLAFTLLTGRRRHAGRRRVGPEGAAHRSSSGSKPISAMPTCRSRKIAGANGMSLRYLHLLFEDCEMSASEWIWNRRLQLAYDEIAKGDGRSITSIAFDHGFNSSAHFSTMFRRKYGVSPRDVARRTL